MIIYNQTLTITSAGNRVSYHDITEKIREIVEQSTVKDGLCVVASPHTTCSVFFEEYSHDKNYAGDEYLQVDLNNVLEKVVPRCLSEGQYYHPGPEHTKFGVELPKEKMRTEGTDLVPDKRSLLNTEAHIKGTFIGSSETFIIENKELQIGKVGYIYFVDWDQNRVRYRQCKVQIIGQ